MFCQNKRHTTSFAEIFERLFPKGYSRLQGKCNQIERMEKFKASNKKMKKYKDLYKEEKRRHEEVLQRY